MIYYAVFPWVWYPFFVYLGVDPPNILYRFILSAFNHPFNTATKLAILPVRLFYIFICCFEGARMFGFYVIYLILKCIGNCAVYEEIVSRLDNVTRDAHFFSEIDQICHYFNRFIIINQHGRVRHMNYISLGYFTLFSLAVPSNFATIKMYHSFDLIFYLVFATLSVVVLVGFPKISQPLIESNQSLERVMSKLREMQICGEIGADRGRIKILAKRIKSILTVKTSLGLKSLKFMDCTMDMKSGIFYAIMDYTISALLSINVK